MRTFAHRIAAVAIVCVFASLPSLARIHDRLSARDDVTRFRLSQNLERPHEKIDAAPLVAMPAFRVAREITPYRNLVDTRPPAIAAPFSSPPTSRAPPVR